MKQLRWGNDLRVFFFGVKHCDLFFCGCMSFDKVKQYNAAASNSAVIILAFRKES